MPSPSVDKKEKSHLPEQGQVVKLRSRTWLVESVDTSAGSAGTVITLACLDDDAQGQPLKVIWEVEINPQVVTKEVWKSIGRKDKVPTFDTVRDFAAYFRTLRWNCVSSTNSQLFQSPFRAGIQIKDYQLTPLAKALKLPQVKLFIADDVGLGKTVEAGLVASELLLRKRVDQVIIACPPSMVFQWRDEMESKFGLNFEILDREYLEKVRQTHGFAANPWGTNSKLIVSHKLLIDEKYTGPLRSWLGDLKPASLLVFDECHNAAPASGGKSYAIDSKITKAIRDLSKRFEHKLFLSATPHNGHSNSYSALLNLLDDVRFCRGIDVDPGMVKDIMVRRLKEDIRVIGADLFPERKVERILIDGLPDDCPELALPKLLADYYEIRKRRVAGLPPGKRSTTTIVFSTLQQRLLSSIKAFHATLVVHRKTMERVWAKDAASAPQFTETQAALLTAPVGADDELAQCAEEERAGYEARAMESATLAAGGDSSAADIAEEKAILDKMIAIASTAADRPDQRVMKLLEIIQSQMCKGVNMPGKDAAAPGAAWNDRRIIIFTQWDETLRWLKRILETAIRGSDRDSSRIEVYSGSTGEDKREAIKIAFTGDTKVHPVRILLCNDAAREGLNLQDKCHQLFHFDLPWNPGRLEQRNGRIDRKMQPSPVVYCYYFKYAQRPEDRILEVLIQKTQRIRAQLGSVGLILEEGIASKLEKGGIDRKNLDALADEIGNADLDPEKKAKIQAELEAVRQGLKEEIDEMRTCLHQSQQAIGLGSEWRGQLRDSISVALEKMDLPALKEVTVPSGGPKRYMLPETVGVLDVDGGLSRTMDTLRLPPKDGLRNEEWRKASPIRPIVLEAGAVNDHEVSLVHLGHPLVKRLLGRFVTQGFVHHDLSRAVLGQTEDSIPRVVLVGRLLLVGQNACRLHEQLVFATARVNESSKDLKIFDGDDEKETARLLESAMSSPGPKIPDRVQAKLLERIEGDVGQLLDVLTKRADSSTVVAKKELQKRAKEESAAMKVILQRLLDSIKKGLASKDINQLELVFNEAEMKQLRSNQNYWKTRISDIEADLEDEPKRVASFYNVTSVQLQPVGLAYLWPKSS